MNGTSYHFTSWLFQNNKSLLTMLYVEHWEVIHDYRAGCFNHVIQILLVKNDNSVWIKPMFCKNDLQIMYYIYIFLILSWIKFQSEDLYTLHSSISRGFYYLGLVTGSLKNSGRLLLLWKFYISFARH